MVVALEQLTKKYPNGKIEDSTIEFMKGIFRPYDCTLPEFYMPYDLALVYFRGGKAFEERNYSGVVKYYSEFIERADENNPKIIKLLALPYLYLLNSYKKLDKMTEGEKIKSKMIALFPEKKEQIERIWSMPAPK